MQLLNGPNKFFPELYLDRLNFQACFIAQWMFSDTIQCFEEGEKKWDRFLCHVVSCCISYVKSVILNNLCMVSWLCFSLTPFVHSTVFFFNMMSYSSCLVILVLWKLHGAQGIWMLSYAWPRSCKNEKKWIVSKQLQIVE